MRLNDEMVMKMDDVHIKSGPDAHKENPEHNILLRVFYVILLHTGESQYK